MENPKRTQSGGGSESSDEITYCSRILGILASHQVNLGISSSLVEVCFQECFDVGISALIRKLEYV